MRDKIGFDELAGDIFSLNIRGLKSIAALWRAPRDYFAAAEDANWCDRFTPSIRLWLSLIAVSSLLQFFWIGTDTPLVAAYTEGFRESGVVLTGDLTFEQLGETAALWIFGVFPLMQLLIFLFVLPLFPLWGRPTTYSLRARYGFSMMIPSASVMVFLLPSMALMPPATVSLFGVAIGILSFLIDASTVYRSRLAQSLTGRILRSAALAGLVLLLNVTAHIATQIAGIILVSARYGLTVG
jgi:hypothetical protein